MRGVIDTGTVAVDDIVEPDMLRDEIGGGVSTGVVMPDLGLGGGGAGGGGDGERVNCTGGGSISEVGISETSPGLPSINGDSAEGGDERSIRMLFRRGELARNGGAPRSGETESRALGGAEDVRVWDERSGDDARAGRVSRNGIRLNFEVFRTRGGDSCVDSGGLGGELGPGSLLEDGSGCGGCSVVCGSWWDPLGREVENILGLIFFGSWVVFCMPLGMGNKISEGAVEGRGSDEGNSTIDVGLDFPLTFTLFDGVSFGGVVGGDNVFPLIPELPTLGGRDGGLTMGARVADKFLECRFGFSQSARHRTRSTLSNRPCTPDTAPAAVVSGSSPPPSLFRERVLASVPKFGQKPPSASPPPGPQTMSTSGIGPSAELTGVSV